MYGLSLLLAVGGLTPPTNDAARERLEALIESTNRLEHFHAEYRSTRDGSAGHLKLDYRARGGIRVRGASPKGTMDSGIADGVLWLSSELKAMGRFWAEVDLLDRGGDLEPVLALLREEFWRPPGGAEVSVGFGWGLNAESDHIEPAVDVHQTFVGGDDHAALLGWLHTLRHADGDLVIEDEALVYRADGVHCRVDLRTGFLEQLVLISEDGSELSLALERLDLDDAPADSVFETPTPPPDAEDVSDQVRDSILSPGELRHRALGYVHDLLEREDRDLDGRLRDELRRFLNELFRPSAIRSLADFVERVQASSQEFADWVRDSLAAGRPKSEAQEAIAERRRQLEVQVERGRSKYLEQLPDLEDLADTPAWRAIRELEDEALEESYEAALARPVLEHFEQAIDEALGG